VTLKVFLTLEAERDLEDLYHYVARSSSSETAARLLDALESTCAGLSELPERGHVPPELDELGIADYREILHRPYRIFYRVLDRRVVVYAILDGRRDMRTLLERRLLR
jgi:toxin ParE1/3/4